MDKEIESRLISVDSTTINYYKRYYKEQFIDGLNSARGKYDYQRFILQFCETQTSSTDLILYFKSSHQSLSNLAVVLTRSEINNLPSTVLTSLAILPKDNKLSLLNSFTKQELNRLIGDKLDISKDRYKSLLEDALTSCGTKITYNVYQSKPVGYSSTYGEHRFDLPSGDILPGSDLDQIAKELLKEVFENNRLVIIGDKNGHFIYGLTRQGFLTPRQLFSVAHAGIYKHNKIYSNVFYSDPDGYLDLQLLTVQLKKWWAHTWDQVKSYFPVEIWYDFYYYGGLFRPYFK